GGGRARPATAAGHPPAGNKGRGWHAKCINLAIPTAYALLPGSLGAAPGPHGRRIADATTQTSLGSAPGTPPRPPAAPGRPRAAAVAAGVRRRDPTGGRRAAPLPPRLRRRPAGGGAPGGAAPLPDGQPAAEPRPPRPHRPGRRGGGDARRGQPLP